MNPKILSLIQGDLAQAQVRLRDIGTTIASAIENDHGWVRLTESEKKIIFPILDGLSIPYRDAEPNGTLVGVDQDHLDTIFRTI